MLCATPHLSHGAPCIFGCGHDHVTIAKRLIKKLEYLTQHLDMHPYLVPRNLFVGNRIPLRSSSSGCDGTK